MTKHILIADSGNLTEVGSVSSIPRNRANLFAVTGGLMQIALSLSILCLPVLAMCMQRGQDMECQRQSYIQQGGSPLGYGFLIALIIVGVLAVHSTRVQNAVLVNRIRGLAALVSMSFVIIGAWSIGMLFAPGGVLLLLSALFGRQNTAE